MSENISQNEKFMAVRKLTDNSFLNLYEIDALTIKGEPFHYYFASRRSMDELKVNTHRMDPEGIVVFARCKEDNNKLLMIRQYRYPVDAYIYELPAGLIDEGETPEQAAIREIREETGLNFQVDNEVDSIYCRPYVFAQGISDETGCTVYGYVSGQISSDFLEDSERIEAFYIDKEEARRILSEERVSMRAAYLLMLFINEWSFT